MEEQNYIQKALKGKKIINRTLTGIAIGFGALIFAMLIAIAIRMFMDMNGGSKENENFFDLIALALIVIWFGILIGYYSWAIYFYNINLGLTDEDWAEIRERKKHNPEGVEEPKENPNINQTLGLPTGTVRGTVALTLLVGGVAMTIAGLGMKNSVDTNTFLVDNFEFFKTAFLMMIAFYFGNKSLEMLGYGKKKGPEGEQQTTQVTGGDTDSPPPATSEGSSAKAKLKNSVAKKAADDEAAQPGDPDFNDPNAMY